MAHNPLPYTTLVIPVSVIIPVYNREKTIKYCLDSVLSQTYKNFEVILVDDCSTDNSINIIKSYNDERIKLLPLNKNSGAQYCRNVGIKAASYDWIAFLDSDDEWLPDKLEKQVKILAENKFDPYLLIHSNAILVDKLNNEIKPYIVPHTSGTNVYRLLLQRPAPFFQAMLVSKKALTDINYLDENVPSYQEWDTSTRLAKYCRFIHIEEPTFKYYYHDGDTISKNLHRDIEGYNYYLKKFKSEILKYCGKKAWLNHLITQYNKAMAWGFYADAVLFATKMPLSYNKIKFYIKARKKLKNARKNNS